MLCIAMSLFCLFPPDHRRFAARRCKGHTRDGVGTGKLPVSCRFGAKVTENKRVALCKVLKLFRAISNPVLPMPLRRPLQRYQGATSLRGAAGDVAIQSGTRGSGLLRCARNDGPSRKETIARDIWSRLWPAPLAGNIMSGIRNFLSNITQNRRSLAPSLTNFDAASHFPTVPDFCYAGPKP